MCTDVCGMGVDIQDLNLCLNLGIPKTSWKVKQQSGKIGRNGSKSINITLVFPQKGASAPDAVIRQVFRGDECIRKELNKLFVVESPLSKFNIDSQYCILFV